MLLPSGHSLLAEAICRCPFFFPAVVQLSFCTYECKGLLLLHSTHITSNTRNQQIRHREGRDLDDRLDPSAVKCNHHLCPILQAWNNQRAWSGAPSNVAGASESRAGAGASKSGEGGGASGARFDRKHKLGLALKCWKAGIVEEISTCIIQSQGVEVMRGWHSRIGAM